MRFAASIVLVLGACRAGEPVVARPESSAPPERWLVLGDSVAWDGRWVAHLQTWLVLREGERAPEVLDCALPSETLSGLSEPEHLRHGFARPCLFERLERVLDAVRPDFVLACYGLNDGIYQPFDEARFAAFRAGVERLAGELERRGIEHALLTPPPFDATRADVARGARYDEVIRRYSAWLASSDESVVDLHAALERRVAQERRRDRTFTLSPDGIHPDERGHLWLACELIAALPRLSGGSAQATPLAIESGLTLLADSRGCALDLIRVQRDAWLAHTGHARPGLPAGPSLAEARARAARSRAELVAARDRLPWPARSSGAGESAPRAPGGL